MPLYTCNFSVGGGIILKGGSDKKITWSGDTWTSNQNFRILQSGNNNAELSIIGGSNATARLYLAEAEKKYGFSMYYRGNESDNRLSIMSHNNNDSGEEVLSIIRSSGYVGIGTSAPTANLHIGSYAGGLGDETFKIGDYNFSGSVSTYGDQIFSLTWGLGLGMGPYSSSKGIFGNQGLGVHLNNDEEFSVRSGNWSKLFAVLGKNGVNTGGGTVPEDSRVFVGGKLGIGTTDPGAKLEIIETDTTNNDIAYPLILDHHLSSGNPDEGIGTGIYFRCQRDAGTYAHNGTQIASIEGYGAAGIPGTSDQWNLRFKVRDNDTIKTCLLYTSPSPRD